MFDVAVTTTLYEKLAGEVGGQIQAGVFRPGDRLPSVRQISRQKGLSVTTVLQAYQVLEDRGIIEARPQSGYYVRLQHVATRMLPETRAPYLPQAPEVPRLRDLAGQIYDDACNPNLVQFGAALPAPDLVPGARLNGLLARLARSGRVSPNLLGSAQGCLELRTQVARRLFLAGCQLSPDEVVISLGCTEALQLSLRAICRAGEMVAIESPTYFGILQVIESLGLRALEIPHHANAGMDLAALESALGHYPVRAVVVVTNFSNPAGGSMPDENKQRLVTMLAERRIPLIEDDIYGELSFLDQRPGVAKAYDASDGVILCGSFSKSLTPGYRVGWLAPGRWLDEVVFLKAAANMFSPVVQQLAIAAYLESGGYDHLLRRERRVYAQNTRKMAELLLEYFPDGTRVTLPEGGYVLWVQMPEGVDSLELYRRGLTFGITLAPGYLFAPTPRYRNYIRLNAAILSPENEWAVKRLGDLAQR